MPVESSVSLEGSYFTDGRRLYCVLVHAANGITLEECRSNIATFYRFDQFVALKLERVNRD